MIVGVCGSPRKAATEYVLKQALRMLEEKGFETRFFTVRNKQIGFCLHCDYCLKNKVCIAKDDVVEVYDLFRKADGYVFASPVYNGGLSAQLKAVMDRCRALLAVDKDVFRNKVGMAIAVGGDRVGGQESAIHQILDFYVLNSAIAVSGGAFGSNLGATFWSKDSLTGVKKDEEGFRSLRKTVKRFAEMLKIMEQIKREGV
ncbi:MAG TPA: flavodoxin family protein [Candidatus Bathyarchaeia archaeon]|jgi:multimeric flavodoxin WrbA|nr:flavodoxin family protein [Candidatus Bathyarchaeia archaeon]